VNTKILAAFGIVLIILAIGEGFYLLARSPKSVSQTAKVTPQITATQMIISSIKDMLTKQLSLSCDFKDQNGRHIISFIKNGSVRVDITGKSSQDSASVIVKDKKIYFWNSSIGMMLSEPEITETTSNSFIQTQWNTVVKTVEKYKDSCKNATVSDDKFTLPANVKFKDYSGMMPQVSGWPINQQKPTLQAGY